MPDDEAHLYVLMHGLWGTPRHMLTVEKAIKNSLADVSQEKIVTLKPSSSRFWKTYDGIQRCAERAIADIFYEIETLKQKDGCKVVKISFVGYSLGGLICRHIVGQLYEMNFFDEVLPVFFCTYATPHVGVHFFGRNLLEWCGNFFGTHLLGKTGFELFFGDSEQLLSQMADQNSSYFKGLQLFEKRLLLANIQNDRSVAFYSSFITQYSPFDVWNTVRIKYLKGLPVSKIGSVSVRPKFVDLQRSYRLTENQEFTGNKQEATPLIRSNKFLRWSIIILAASILVPFYLPIIFCLSAYVSAYSILKVKLVKGPDVRGHWKDVQKSVYHGEQVNLKHAQEGQDKRRQRLELGKHDSFKGETSNMTENAVENVLYARDRWRGNRQIASEFDGSENAENIGRRSPSTMETDNSDTDDGVKSNESIAASFLRRKHVIDINFKENDRILLENEHLFKEKDPSVYGLFDKKSELPLLPKQTLIVKSLNSLDWNKVAVYHDAFNAHGAIVGRRGEKSSPKGTSTVYLWASFLRNHLKSD